MPRKPCEQLFKTRAFGKLLCLCCPGRCFKRLWTKWKRRLEEEKKVIVIAFRVVVMVVQIVERSFGTNLDGRDEVKDEKYHSLVPPAEPLGRRLTRCRTTTEPTSPAWSPPPCTTRDPRRRSPPPPCRPPPPAKPHHRPLSLQHRTAQQILQKQNWKMGTRRFQTEVSAKINDRMVRKQKITKNVSASTWFDFAAGGHTNGGVHIRQGILTNGFPKAPNPNARLASLPGRHRYFKATS